MATADATTWKRPKSVPFPSVWLRCTGKVKGKDGKIPNFKIQDVTEDMHDELIDLMVNVFVRDEQVSASVNFVDDVTSVNEFREIWKKHLKQNMALVALVDEEDGGSSRPRIAGANITGVSLKTDKKITYTMFEGIPARIVAKFIFDYALKDLDIFEYYGVDAFMSALGLLVLPEFRGQGLSEYLLKARFPLARAVGLKATMTFFAPCSSTGSNCGSKSRPATYTRSGLR